MHSSRMRTVRCSGCLGGRVCLGGCLPGGVYLGGCLPRGCLPRGVHPLGPKVRHPPLWTEFLTHVYENITIVADVYKSEYIFTNIIVLLNSVFATLLNLPNGTDVITEDVQCIEPVPWRTGDTTMV